MRTNTPPIRLRDFPTGSKVLLTGVERVLTVGDPRPCGYIDLYNVSGHLSVTASPGHECKEAK